MGTTNDIWLTPPEILRELGPFDLDPCSPPAPPWRIAETFYTEEDDGLRRPWHGRVWLNPPYSSLLPWLARLAHHDRGTALVFARTDTEAFFQHVWPCATALLFLRGRLNFHRPDGTLSEYHARAPSVLISYGAQDADLLEAADLDGAFVPLPGAGQLVAVFRPVEGVTWRELLERLIARAGGRITLAAAYALVQGHPKTGANPNWQAKVRQILQGPSFRRIGIASYQLALEEA